MRLEKGGNKGAETPFGDQWHDKCITLYCVIYDDWAPEDRSHLGPGDGGVWIYTTHKQALAAALDANNLIPLGGSRLYRVKVAALVRHGDEPEALKWLREKELIE